MTLHQATINPEKGSFALETDDQKFSVRATLAEIGGQHVLFSEAQQAIYEVNETAALIWNAIENGATDDALVQQLTRSGALEEQARVIVESVLSDWQSRELIQPDLASIQRNNAQSLTQDLAISGLRVRIRYLNGCAGTLPTFFRHLECSDGDYDALWEVIEAHNRLHLLREGQWVASCAPDELPTVLKGYLLNEVLNRDDYEFAVHAATLISDDRAMLLFGKPGAGKTTLTLGLVHAGFQFGGDDVALFRSNSLCSPLPFASAVKTGALRILGTQVPGLAAMPVFRRPDGKRVRYVIPDLPPRTTDYPVRWIILLDRRSGTDAVMKRVDAGEALHGLLEDSFANTGELTEAAFRVLVRAIAASDVYRLTYSRLADAVDLVRRTCR